MSTTREFCCDDLFRFNSINIDKLTETYNLGFYLQYMVTWPDFNFTIESPDGRLQGYILGKAEGKGELWHGHVTALTVGAEYRRLGMARRLMNILEEVSDKMSGFFSLLFFPYKGYFVDLFVRYSNQVAIGMYKTLGYSVYRQVLGYYSGDEDAFDMRKALSRDVEKKSIIPLSKPVHPEDLEW